MKNCNVNKAIFLGALKGLCIIFSVFTVPVMILLWIGFLSMKGFLFGAVLSVPAAFVVFICNIAEVANDAAELCNQKIIWNQKTIWDQLDKDAKKLLYKKAFAIFWYSRTMGWLITACICAIIISITLCVAKEISLSAMIVCMFSFPAACILTAAVGAWIFCHLR